MIKKRIKLLLILSFLSTFANAQPLGYYNGIDGKSGDELKEALHELINGHVDFSYYYSKFIINYSDSDPENPDNVILFYKQESRSAELYGTGGDYINREHVWAKSHGAFADKRPMDGDAFNLRPADASVNTSRSNKDFDNVQPGGTQHPDATECWYNSSSWEPGPATKGQVARILFYMATRYEGTNGELDLEVVDKVYTSPAPKHGKLSTLLEWNNQYPPSDFERRRNERIFNMQQNRNPFVDHPEFINYIWGNETPNGIVIENLNINPEIPNPGDDISISFNLAANSEIPETVTIYWGTTYDSEDNQQTMALNQNTYSANINLDFQAEERVYFKIKSVKGGNIKYTRGNILLPKAKESLTFTPISDVQGDGSQSPLKGNIVTISGRVCANFDGTVYIQNGDQPRNGVCVYGANQTGNIGDSLVITGEVTEYSNLTELTDVSYVYNFKDNQPITPIEVSITDINEEYEGMLVKVKNVEFHKAGNTISGGNASYTFSNQDGSSDIFAKQDSRISGKTLPSGVVDLVGVVSQYSSTYQLLPRDMNDFMSTTNTDDNYRLHKSIGIYPNPTSNGFKIKTTDIIEEIKIVDMTGRVYFTKSGNFNHVSVENLDPGIYILQVSLEEKGIHYAKFLKEE